MHTDFTKILNDFKAIPKHKQTKTFMEISGYPHYENVCSNILAFYFDPSNEHQFEDLFLNSLLHIVEKDFCVDLDYEKIIVHREYQTENYKRIDIVIETDNYVIGIENKIFHHLNNDLEDYYKTITTLCHGKRKPIAIILSLNELNIQYDIEFIRKNHFANITYKSVFQNIKQNIGKYLSSSNISHINYITDFIKSIENLTPKTMENRALYEFFKNNSEILQELTDSFSQFKKSLYQRVFQLKDTLTQSQFAPTSDRQWISEGRCLVHDYIINSKYKLGVDVKIDVKGWKIIIFGRDVPSTNFLFDIMFRDLDFLPKPFENFEIKKYGMMDRLIYQRFDTDTDISSVARVLADLLTRIENYKKRTELEQKPDN